MNNLQKTIYFNGWGYPTDLGVTYLLKNCYRYIHVRRIVTDDLHVRYSTHGHLRMFCCIICIFKYCHKIILESSLTLLINEGRSGTQPGDDYIFKLLKILFSKCLRNKYNYFHTIYIDNTNLSLFLRLLLLSVWFTMFCPATEYIIYSINPDQPPQRR
jgi:hypothetical protein